MTHAAWNKYAESANHNPDLLNFEKFAEIMECLQSKTPVHLARYNDGEWVFMLRTEPYYSRLIVRSNYSRPDVLEISRKMLSVIDSKPSYYIGIDSTTLAGIGSIAQDFHVFSKKIEGLNLVYGEMFNAALVMYGIDALRKPLAGRWVLTVGPAYMDKLKLGNQHVSVPTYSCWSNSKSIEDQVEAILKANLDKQPVVIYACSLLAKWLVDVMYRKFGNRISQLDIGSCIDPWCGVNSRPWHRSLANYYNLTISEGPPEPPTVIIPASISTGLPAPQDTGYGHQNFNPAFGSGYGEAKDYVRNYVRPYEPLPLSNKPRAYTMARGDRSGSVINESIFVLAHCWKKGLEYVGACGHNPTVANHFEHHLHLSKMLGIPAPSKTFPLNFLSYVQIKAEDYGSDVYPDVNQLLDTQCLKQLRARLALPKSQKETPQCIVHIRRGDVLESNQMRYTPNSYYLDIIKQVKTLVPTAEVTVFSESESSESFDVFSDMGCKLQLDGDLFTAWTQMIQADILVMSKSSFSYVPAIYNDKLVIYQPAWYAKLNHWYIGDDARLWDEISKLG